MEVGLSPGNFVLDGDPAPPQKGGGASQIFGPCLLWPNGWMDQDGTWHGAEPPNFLACIYCSQTAARIKMQFGTELGLGPDDIV